MNFGTYSLKRTHRLWPANEVFQAEVWSGSIWTVVPDLSGPINNLYKNNTTIYKGVYVFLQQDWINHHKNILELCTSLQFIWCLFWTLKNFQIDTKENHHDYRLSIINNISTLFSISFLSNLLLLWIRHLCIFHRTYQNSNTS